MSLPFEPMESANTLKKEERLYHKKRIDLLFQNGRWLRSTHLRFVYLPYDELEKFPAQAFFSVPKKRFRRAVMRNLLKRRLKESYRLNKSILYDTLIRYDKKVIIGFLYNSNEIANSAELKKQVKSLLAQLSARIK